MAVLQGLLLAISGFVQASLPQGCTQNPETGSCFKELTSIGKAEALEAWNACTNDGGYLPKTNKNSDLEYLANTYDNPWLGLHRSPGASDCQPNIYVIYIE